MKVVLALLALTASVSRAQIDPTACTTNNALTYTYALTTPCTKGVIDHKNGNNNQQVKIKFDFPFSKRATADGPLSTQDASKEYDIFVWSSDQGSGTDSLWSFSTSPRTGPVLSQSGMASRSFLTKQANGGFATSSRSYLYYRRVSEPSGRWEINFATLTSAGANDKLRYIVAVKAVDASVGHKAHSSTYPIWYNWGQQRSSAAWVSLAGTSGTVVTRARNYGPGTDGRLVQDVVVKATVSTNLAGVNSATLQATTFGASQSSTMETLSSGTLTAEIPFAPVVLPRTSGNSTVAPQAGWLQTVWSLQVSNGALATPKALDLTANPGPYIMFRPGATTESFTEAMTLTAGAAATTVTFNSEAKSNSDTRATLSHKLFKIMVPSKWHYMSLTASVRASNGDNTDADIPASDVLSVWGAYAAGGSYPNNPRNIPNGISVDPRFPGQHIILNRAISGMSSDGRAFASVGSFQWLSWSSPTSPYSLQQTNPNYPLWDSRSTAGIPVYILACRSSGCGTGSSTTNPTRYVLSVTVDTVRTFNGECDSDADCKVPSSGSHPAADRAALSANGDVNRFSSCLLFPGPDGNSPETRCVECFNDCDCRPNQICSRYTGIESIGGVKYVASEKHRLRAGVCTRRDVNNTILNRPCRSRNYNTNPSALQTTTPYDTSSPGSYRPRMKEDTDLICGEFITVNASKVHTSNTISNITGQVDRMLWYGYCDSESICRACRSSVARGSSYQTCGNSLQCLDGNWHASVSLDGTARTLNNNVSGAVLVTILVFLLFILFLAFVHCCCTFMCSRRGGEKKAAVATS